MFNSITSITNYLIALLKLKCKNIKTVELFPVPLTEFPIAQPTVSVGLQTAEIHYGEGVYEGDDTSGNSYYGATVGCTYSLKICVPKGKSSLDCYTAFDTVADACLGIDELNIIRVFLGEIHYDRSMGALVLSAGIDLTAKLETVIKKG